MKIYRECTKQPYSFLINDTMLPASDSLRLRKKCFNLIKVTVADQLTIIDNKINEIQHNMI